MASIKGATRKSIMSSSKHSGSKKRQSTYALALQPQMPTGYTMAQRRKLREFSKSITSKYAVKVAK